MPLTEPQRENITEMVTSVNLEMNEIVRAREDLLALMRFDAHLTDVGCASVIAASRLKAKNAAAALVTLLG